jgi:RNA polymerase sigma-70 factor, ECF subfamily
MAQSGANDETPAAPQAKAKANATLGGLLYADASRERTPESEWLGLVRNVARGDQLALRTLYERAHRLVFTLALRLTGSRETAEELTVDVFHGLWRRASAYDPDAGTVLAWIMNQARSRTIDRLRHDHRRKRVNPGTHDEGLAPGGLGEATALADRADDARALQQAMAGLPSGERQAIQSAFYAEMTHAEVAERLDEPLGTIKTRIRSGLTRLRKALLSGGGA